MNRGKIRIVEKMWIVENCDLWKIVNFRKMRILRIIFIKYEFWKICEFLWTFDIEKICQICDFFQNVIFCEKCEFLKTCDFEKICYFCKICDFLRMWILQGTSMIEHGAPQVPIKITLIKPEVTPGDIVTQNCAKTQIKAKIKE